MNITNKVVAFLGDSITEGVGTSSVEHVYWKEVERRSGARCYGYGISGTRIAPNLVPSPDPNFDLYFASRVDEMISEADVVVVFGGTNDYGTGDAAFGELSSMDSSTFCGACHHLFQKLSERYPTSLVIVMTPLHRLDDFRLGLNEFGIRRVAPLEGYVDAITAIAGHYAFPVLDLFRTSGLQPDLPVLREQYMPDGLHPNDAGHRRIADRLLGFLSTI